MDPIDELLNGLKPDPSMPSPESPPQPSPKKIPVNSLDQLLADVAAQTFNNSASSNSASGNSASGNSASTDLLFQTQSNVTASIATNSTTPPITTLVPELAAYSAEQTAIAMRKAEEQQQAQQRQAQQKQQQLETLQEQRRQALRSQAQQWLDNLDRKSPEGLWFEEFACNHATPIEAAIDYLAALQEVDRFLGH